MGRDGSRRGECQRERGVHERMISRAMREGGVVGCKVDVVGYETRRCEHACPKSHAVRAAHERFTMRAKAGIRQRGCLPTRCSAEDCARFLSSAPLETFTGPLVRLELVSYTIGKIPTARTYYVASRSSALPEWIWRVAQLPRLEEGYPW